MTDLQEVIDELAARIRRPISVEDRRWRLLAYSAHATETDTVRSTSILTREAPAAAADWLESLGLQRATGPMDIPANPALGMVARTCQPVRHGDVLLGWMWVLVGDRPLDDDHHAAMRAAAGAVETLLWERRLRLEEQQRLVRAVVEDGDAAAAAGLRLGAGARLAVAVADTEEAAAELARRRWPHGPLAWATHGASGIVAVASLPPAGAPAALAQTLVDAGAERAGAAAAGDVDQAPAALAEAVTALTVVRAVPALGPATASDQLGGWGLVTGLWDAAGRPAPPAPVQTLLAHRQGEELARTLEAVLETGGDADRAAEHLHVHRATLYRRLRRAQEVSGLDLARGDDRLVLQLGLRLWRLGAAAG